MNVIVLATEWHNVRLESLGDGVVLQVSTATDVRPYQQQLKPHYFDTLATAKAWMIEQAYGMLKVGYNIVD